MSNIQYAFVDQTGEILIGLSLQEALDELMSALSLSWSLTYSDLNKKWSLLVKTFGGKVDYEYEIDSDESSDGIKQEMYGKMLKVYNNNIGGSYIIYTEEEYLNLKKDNEEGMEGPFEYFETGEWSTDGAGQ